LLSAGDLDNGSKLELYAIRHAPRSRQFVGAATADFSYRRAADNLRRWRYGVFNCFLDGI